MAKNGKVETTEFISWNNRLQQIFNTAGLSAINTVINNPTADEVVQASKLNELVAKCITGYNNSTGLLALGNPTSYGIKSVSTNELLKWENFDDLFSLWELCYCAYCEYCAYCTDYYCSDNGNSCHDNGTVSYGNDSTAICSWG